MFFASVLTLLAHLLVRAQGKRSNGLDFGWRMPCGRFPEPVRLDPLVFPGEVSAHAHVFHGASSFSAWATYDDLRNAQCTTCEVEQDKSLYWIPPLYFHGADGKYTLVPQTGGVLVYYRMFHDNTKAFPPGFRMLAGDANRNTTEVPTPDRETSFWTPEDRSERMLRQRALGFNCLHYTPDGHLNERTIMRHEFPDNEKIKSCKDGLRLEVVFPSCWDGVNNDSPDHKSHVAYSDMVIDGACPASHPVPIPHLMYEIIFEVAPLLNSGQQGRFVLATGDYEGHSMHADFFNGWDEGFLQQAIQTCQNGDGTIQQCPLFTLKSQNCEGEDAKPLAAVRREVCSEPMDQLCGNPRVGMAHAADGPLPDPPAAPFLVAPAIESVQAVPSDSPPATAQESPAAVSEPPEPRTATIIVQTTVTQDVATLTVFDMEKRHVHHPHQG
jgi:hypothetical protein